DRAQVRLQRLLAGDGQAAVGGPQPVQGEDEVAAAALKLELGRSVARAEPDADAVRQRCARGCGRRRWRIPAAWSAHCVPCTTWERGARLDSAPAKLARGSRVVTIVPRSCVASGVRLKARPG